MEHGAHGTHCRTVSMRTIVARCSRQDKVQKGSDGSALAGKEVAEMSSVTTTFMDDFMARFMSSQVVTDLMQQQQTTTTSLSSRSRRLAP